MVICCIGDSLTLGYGDESGLGWPGNITAALHKAGQDVTTYNLGIRKDTTQFIQHRWQTETALRRLDGQPAKLVFSFGVADIMNAIETEQSLAAALTILTRAKETGDVLLIGPTPVNDPQKTEEITLLSDLLAAMCKQIDIPYIPTVDAMQQSSVYRQSLIDGDTVHPTASGYAELAAHILQNETARTFFGLE